MTAPRSTDDTGSRGIGTATGWLAAGLTTLTASLAAVGGLTGGIARIFRNHSPWGASLPFILVLLGVLAALLVAVFQVKGTGEPAAWVRWVLGVAVGLSLAGVFVAVYLIASTVSIEDRPTLSADLVEGSSGAWTLKGAAVSSGLGADAKIQVYLYALPTDTEECEPSDGSTKGGLKVTMDAACGRRLFYGTTGPDVDGVARQTFSVPLPDGKDLQSFVLTATLGNVPRTCEGTPLRVATNLDLQTPPMALQAQERRTTACITFLPPR